MSRALALIETHEGTNELAEPLDAALAQTRAHASGLTGPPGVGKSTLTHALLRDWRILFVREDDWRVPVILASAKQGAGLAELRQAPADHRAWAARTGALESRRETQRRAWVDEAIRTRFGTEGLAWARTLDPPGAGPFHRELKLARELSRRLG